MKTLLLLLAITSVKFGDTYNEMINKIGEPLSYECKDEGVLFLFFDEPIELCTAHYKTDTSNWYISLKDGRVKRVTAFERGKS